MRPVFLILAASVCLAQEGAAEKLIEEGHWKRARALVERRLHDAPLDANALFLSSQIRNAFGDRVSPPELAEKAVRLSPGTARYHRQVAEVQGVMAQHAGMFQQVILARRFRKEIDAALELDPRDTQALRDLLEFYLLAPGLIGGDPKRAEGIAERIGAVDTAVGLVAKARIAEFHKDSVRTKVLLQQAAELRPPSYKALMALAEFEFAPAHRDDAAAEAAAHAAIAIDPGRAGAYGILASVYAGREGWTALDAALQSAAAAVPDDLTPYYRAAERILIENRDPMRAARYLQMYLAQEPEGNQPTLADARRKLTEAARSGGAN